MLTAAAMLAACLLASCASDSASQRSAGAAIGIAHTCNPSQQPIVDRFAEHVRANLDRAIDGTTIPIEARTHHLHGRVIVVVGYTDGERQRVGIAQSTGYAALDNHALDLVDQATPEHAADLPCDAVTVRLAIAYDDGRGGFPIANAIRPRSTFATPVW